MTPISLVVVADAAGFFTVTGTIPPGATPGDYQIRVDFPGGPGVPFVACVARVGAAATPTPTPTVAPVTPTPRPADDDDDGPTQTQQQEQTINFPVAAPVPIPVAFARGGGSSLPKTGVDVAEVGGLGTLSLLTGVSLVEFARRRRRHWLAPAPAAVATEVVSDYVPVAPTPLPEPVVVGGEADLLLPYIGPKPLQPDDFITPSF